MEGDEETKKCPMCEKDIPISKFRMHEIGCTRSNYRCPKCNKCVAKADKEEHDENECEFSPNVIAMKKAKEEEERQHKIEEEKRIKEE